MYLLNLDVEGVTSDDVSLFTFHYVSIKSHGCGDPSRSGCRFTFHYVSIKSLTRTQAKTQQPHLHSTMYLLNQIKAMNTLTNWN